MTAIPVEIWIAKAKKNPALREELERQRPWYELQRSIILARKAAGLTQEEIAQAMHTTKSAISRLENSDKMPNMKTLAKFAEVLHCRLEVRLVPHDQ